MAMKFQSCIKWITVGILVIVAGGAWAGEIVLRLEEPTSGSIYSGVANIRGWVVGSRGINRVELYIDGAYESNIPVGGRRTDVGNDYPTYPNSADSGFSMAFNYSEKVAGTHSILVRAFDQDNASKEETRLFVVTRFDNPYANNASLNDANVAESNGKTIVINGMTVDGKSYNARLDWRTEIQGYAFSEITKISNSNEGDEIVFPYFLSPGSGVAGGQINIQLQAHNNGNQLVTFTVRFFLSPDPGTVSSDEYLNIGCEFSLAPGASDICAGPIGIPRVVAGNYYLIGYVRDDFPFVRNPITITSGDCYGECGGGVGAHIKVPYQKKLYAMFDFSRTEESRPMRHGDGS